MRKTLAKALNRLADWVGRKAPLAPFAPGMAPVEGGRLRRSPSASELFAELRDTTYACAVLNAGACAAYPPRLYVRTQPEEPAPRCRTRALAAHEEKALRRLAHRTGRLQGATRIEEVEDHPLLDLFRSVNEEHNAWDLWELTALHLEVVGSAYWLVEMGPLGVPVRLWPLPPQSVRSVRSEGSPLVESYEVRQGTTIVRYRADEVIAFKFPDPRDPYGPGLSPLRACFEHALLDAEYLALKRAKFGNHALPGVVLSPVQGALGAAEAERLRLAWDQLLRHGGQGRAVVAESELRVHVLSQALGDLSALAEMGAGREVIANAFGVPAPFLFRETNLANLQAAETLHSSLTVRPRLIRRDEKLNERLVPLFDPSGRLFLASDDPRPADRDRQLRQQIAHVRAGIRTINEVRAELGLPPVPWGDQPPTSGQSGAKDINL